MRKRFNWFVSSKKVIFIFFLILVFVLYRALFQSYFEMDEWFAFTLNLPLTQDPFGFLKIMVMEGGDSQTLVQSQHIVPLSRGISFLNTVFFGLNFFPYALISLLLHSLNSFLVYLFIRLLYPRKPVFAFLGGLFFALSPVSMHAVTWAATYGTNSLPVTLSLLSLILFKLAFLRKKKKIIYFSVIFLFLALSAKETAFILFMLLPIMAVFEKRIFPLKFLIKVFSISLITYLLLRFLLPGMYSLPALMTHKAKPIDTKTVVSRDLSIYENLVGEIIFRTVSYPIRMTGTSFLPRQTTFSFVQLITPVVSPVAPGGDKTKQIYFLYESGNYVVIYLVSLAIIIFCLKSIIGFIKRKQISQAQTLSIGLATIVSSALPLVAIVLSFPRWGYDFYFDSRYYYSASIGAAMVFPFLITGIGEFISRQIYFRKTAIVVSIVFIIWLITNMYAFNLTIKQYAENYRPDRREVVRQLKNYLPSLPEKAVFYFATDGKGAFGPNLPFHTSIPQALTVVYYDTNPLPDSFFDKPLFSEKPQGYQYDDGRGFGYYTSKKELSDSLISGSFSINDIHAFYYDSQKVELKNITPEIRKEMGSILKNKNNEN